MAEPADSTKRLEVEVKRLTTPRVQGEHEGPSAAGAHNLASPEVSYVGSKVDHEGAFPTGMRHRVVEAPLGSKLGYHELDDDKEEGDEEWMLGEASSLSGAGSRGSKNWVLKVMVPILLIVGIICMHQWWTDIKEGASSAIDAVGDAFDRRALQEETEARGGEGSVVDGDQEAALGKRGGGAAGEERQARVSDKAVYSVELNEGEAAVETQA